MPNPKMWIRLLITLKQPLTVSVVPGVSSLDVLKIIGQMEGSPRPDVAGETPEQRMTGIRDKALECLKNEDWAISPERILASQHTDWIDFCASSVRMNKQYFPRGAIQAWELLSVEQAP